MNIIEEIKSKKELKYITDSIVKSTFESYLKQNGISDIKNLKQKERKLIVKEVRSRLRKYIGRYQVKYSFEKRLSLLKEGKIKQLLTTHSSTKERLPHYSKLIKIINKIDPKSILDLACGLNPIALASPGVKYIASDIKEDDIELVNIFFKKKGVPGKATVLDLRSANSFPKADLTLLLKVHILETKSHKLAKKILSLVKSKNIIISFSTRTLSGKQMRSPRREWLEDILTDLKYKLRIFDTDNEIFYVAEK
jgi:2-polyprenyl-3-methyl-5-hydroxy-6-metoxy-1,4-benzoquinol methylase